MIVETHFVKIRQKKYILENDSSVDSQPGLEVMVTSVTDQNIMGKKLNGSSILLDRNGWWVFHLPVLLAGRQNNFQP